MSDNKTMDAIALEVELEELKKKYQELQLRVTRFSVIEQQLINARNRLDRELVVHKGLQAFSTKAFGEMSNQAYAKFVAETLVDIFEIEIGFSCFLDPENFKLPVYDFEGYGKLDVPATGQLVDFLQEKLHAHKSGRVLLLHLQEEDPIRNIIPLSEVMVVKMTDPESSLQLILMAGISDKGISQYDMFDLGKEAAFAVFSQQVMAHQANRNKTETIRRQFNTLSVEQQRVSKIAETLLSFTADLQENTEKLLELTAELLGCRRTLYITKKKDGFRFNGLLPQENFSNEMLFLQLLQQCEKDVKLITDLSSQQFAIEEPWFASNRLNTFLGSTVKVDQKTLGWLCLFFEEQPTFSERDYQLLRILSAALAVEERRRMAMSALEESEERYRMIFEGTPNAILVAEEGTHRFVYANSSACQLFQFNSHELVEMGMGIEDIHPKGSYYESLAQLDALFPNQNRIATEVTCVKKDGSLFYADISSHKLELGGRMLITGFFTDVTERKQAREVLIENNVELKKINAELDNFVYSVSHDLRSPLLAIRGLITLVEIDETLKEETHTYLDMISSSVNRMDDAIKEILEYSRNARLEVKSELIDLQALAVETFEDVKHMFPDPISMQLELAINSPFYSDLSRVKTLFKNLIGNAVKYRRYGEEPSYLNIRIHVNEEKAILQFEDNGEGIAPEHIGRIFDMFYRASNATVGTGLGLYICKEIIINLGGVINVSSQVGKGTIFVVQLQNHLLLNS